MTEELKAEHRQPAYQQKTHSVVIRPPKGSVNLDFGELWQYRDLLYFLTRREILVRYSQAAFGSAWAILQPLTAMVIFTVFFGHLAKIPSDGVPYPLFSYSGLVIWSFFSQAVSQSSNSLITNVNLVTKVYFPRLLMPTAPIISSLLDLGIAGALLLVLMPYYGVFPPKNIWALPLPIGIAFITACGVGFGLSALNVKYRDFRYVLQVLLQLWMFASPVVYPTTMVPESLRLVYAINPMTGVLECFRWSLLGTSVNVWPLVAISAVSSLVIFLAGVRYFRKTEEFFADVI